MSNWWNKKTNVPLEDKNFRKIIEFYLFNCPSEIRKTKNGKTQYQKVSQRSTTLRERGWRGGLINTLIANLKYGINGKLEYNVLSAKADIDQERIKIENIVSLSDEHFEMITMAERSDMNIPSSIFYYIRNALAHGTFSVVTVGNNKTYYLESGKDDKVKAQLRLREETLLKWIKDFEFSPNMLKSALQEKRKHNKKERKIA